MLKKIDAGFLFPAIVLVVFIAVLSRSMFNTPAIGKFMNPFIGSIQNERGAAKNNTAKIGVTQPVKVHFDNRKVPHIFAASTNDLYAAQGYTVAADRLWQMDFISYVAAGRLSEIYGAQVNGIDILTLDRMQRRKGMLEAAKKSLAVMEKDPVTKAALDHYTKGVNSFISNLTYKTKPFEYKLLDYSPEPWTNLKSALILKYMANELSGYEEDEFMTQMKLALGNKDFKQLYPDYHNYTANPQPQPGISTLKPDSLPYCDYINYSFLNASSSVWAKNFKTEMPPRNSNCWAVAPAKSKSGRPILCNDPHLGLSLPSVWYEIQLTGGGMNVYGVSIPGTPGVIIGFNDQIAWGVTNGSTDVKDWYKLKIKADYSEYEFDGKWLPATMRVDTLMVRSGKTVYDTVYSTMHGPIVADNRFTGNLPAMQNYALRWTLHEPSDEIGAFLKLNRAQNFTDFENALRGYKSPIQNFTFASKNGDIAMRHQGLVYKKFSGAGKFFLDGTRKDHYYDSAVAFEQLPATLNPAEGFVFSANNRPEQKNNSYYLHGNYAETRANGIKNKLGQPQQFSVEEMQQMQLDITNQTAKAVLPVLLKNLAAMGVNDKRFQALSQWDCQYKLTDTLAPFFENWWWDIKVITYDELNRYSFFSRPPDDYVLLQLIAYDSANRFFDRINTAERETAKDLILNSYQKISSRMNTGKPLAWSEQRSGNLMHPTLQNALSRTALPMPGYREALNAITPIPGTPNWWGPSWRMVVELGDKPKAWGIYAGGQTGNPADKGYDAFVGDWLKGAYYPLNFYMNAGEAEKQNNNTWTLN